MKKCMLLVIGISVTMPCAAGEVLLSWSDPSRFSDIEPGPGTTKATLASVQNAFTNAFKQSAAALPQGYTFTADITNVDLAGIVNPPQVVNPNLISTRVMTANYFPALTLSYTLTDADGKVQVAGENVTITDMDYLSRTNSAVSSTPFYYEDRMIRNWFNRAIVSAVK
jgi:hypothetical protein